MKRGQLPLESLVGIVLRVLGVVVLIAILYLLISPFLSRAKTDAEKDFQRILNDIDDVMQEPYRGEDITLKVPVTTSVQVIAYSGGPSAPEQCKSKPCVCLNEGGRMTCKVYNSLEVSCPVLCQVGGQARCVRSSIADVKNNAITVKRGCNDVSFEGVQI